MANLIDLLTEQLSGAAMDAITQKIGGNNEQTETAIGSLLPIIINALANNSADKQGSEALHRAVVEDHDGGILENMFDFIQNAEQGPGAGILRHVFGDRRGMVEEVVGSTSGLSSNATGTLLETLAPIIMGMLGKKQREEELDDRGLHDILSGTVAKTAEKEPKSMGIIGRLLDRDGDGDIKDDIAEMGFNFLTKLMMGKK